MSYKAFICGIDTLGLKYCAISSNSLSESLQQHNYEVFSPLPSKPEILSEFDNFVDSLCQTDTAIIYFSGHGILEKKRLSLVVGDDLSRQTNCLNLTNIIDQFSTCRAANKLVILDCCHANKSVADLTIDFSDRIIVMSSSDKLEKSIEIDELKGSLFTVMLCRSLETLSNKAVRNGNSSVLVSMVSDEVTSNIKSFNHTANSAAPLPKLFGTHTDFKFLNANGSGNDTLDSLTHKHDREKSILEGRYCELLLKNCDIVSLGNLPEQDRHLALRPLELRRLYVPLRAWVDVKKGDDAKDADWAEIENRRQFSLGGLQQITPHSRRSKRSSIGARLEESRKLVVLGDPGSGKTTLLRWLATAYLLKNSNPKAWSELPDINTLPHLNVMPIMVRCRELDMICVNGTLDDILEHTLRKSEIDPTSIDALRIIFRARLDDGSALLLLDGLDEISDPIQRASFCSQLERIHLAFPKALIVATSRIVGYREMGSRMGYGFEHITLADLEPDEKDDFVNRWCSLTEPPDRVSIASKDLIRDVHSSDRIERMTGNPMLLTTMALVKRKVGKLPSRRAELYSEAVQVLLNWRSDSNPNVSSRIDHIEARPQLEYIAYAMCLRGVQRLRRSEIIDLLREMRRDFPNLHQICNRSPEEFLKKIEANTGLIIEAGRERDAGGEELVYEFRHLTFQEFLAACSLVNGNFQNRDVGLKLEQVVAPLAAETAELAFIKNGKKEVAVAENWREALRLVATICHNNDVEGFLLAILNQLPREDTAFGRARAILAVFCIADEPNTSGETVLKIFNRFISHIDSRDSNVEVRTGVHVAALAIVGTLWSKVFETTLIDRFSTLPALHRDPVGDVAGIVIASEALLLADIKIWWQSQTEALESGDQKTIIRSALGIASVAMKKKIAYPTKKIISLLIGHLKNTPPVAHASAQALSTLSWASGNQTWQPSIFELTELLAYIEAKDSDPEAVRFLMQISGYENIENSIGILEKWVSSDNDNLRREIASALACYESNDAVILLHRLSNDCNADVRENAVVELGAMNFDDVTELLYFALEDSDAKVRLAAAMGLDRNQKSISIEKIAPFLSDSSSDVRARLIYVIGGTKDKNAGPLLLPLVDDGSIDVSIAAIRNIGRLNFKGATAKLILTSQNEDVRVRSVVAQALGELNSKNAVTCLIKMLSDKSDEVNFYASRSLASIGGEKSRDALYAGIGQSSENRRTAAAIGLAEVSPPPNFQDLLLLLRGENVELKCGAIEALGHMKSTGIVSEIVEHLLSPSPVRESAIFSLGFIGGKKAEFALLEQLEKENEFQEVTIHSLGRMKSKKALRVITSYAIDENCKNQVDAIEALGMIATKAAHKTLLKLTRDDDEMIRACALEALSFDEDFFHRQIISSEFDGGWPMLDPAKIITYHYCRMASKITKVKFDTIVQSYETLALKFGLRLAWKIKSKVKLKI